MKNVFLVVFMILGLGVSTNLQAQTTADATKKTECKKMVDCNPANCTPEQIAACQKICGTKTAATNKNANAVAVVNQSPEKKATCNKPCTAKSAEQSPISPVRLVGLEEAKEAKKSCNQPCQKTAEAKKDKKG